MVLVGCHRHCSRFNAWMELLPVLSQENSQLTFSLTTVELGCTWLNKNLCISFVYGPCDRNLREDFFKELSTLHGVLQGPWLLCGDFNITMRLEDRKGNPQCCLMFFLNLVLGLSLINLDLKGRD